MNYSVPNVSVVIPSLNPDEKLASTVTALIEIGFRDILLVNDGSSPEFLHFFPTDFPECTLLTHPVNRGKGAALKTAFHYYLQRERSTDGIITVDGDGQHSAEDVLRCAQAMVQEDAVVLGVRDFTEENIPLRSRMGNRITSLVFRLFCGLKIADTQTGLRAIPAAHLPAMLEVEGDRYEYETNMLFSLKERSVPYVQEKIKTIYIEENQTSHFRPIRDSVRIYGRILRFVASSLLSSLLDLGLFFLLSCFLPGILGPASDAVCTLIARIASSLFNFTMNRRKVFRSKSSAGTSMLRYYILAVGILILSSASITTVSLLFGLHDGSYALIKTVCKFLIDSLLFILSFRVQQNWVFAADKPSSTENH